MTTSPSVKYSPPSVRAQGMTAERLAERADNAPHALLLTGPPGCAIDEVARWVAGTIVGAAGDESRDLQLAHNGVHPDILDVVSTGATFSVNDDIRDVVLVEARRAPTEGSRKVILIHEAERLDDAPANALLRTLEEPPEWITFLLTATRPEAVFATIRSRCERFDLQAISPEAVVDILTAEGIGIEAARHAVAEVGADIDRARLIAGPYARLVDAATQGIQRLDGSAYSAITLGAELAALLDETAEAVDNEQREEREALAASSDQFSPRTLSALKKRLELRQTRHRRKARTHALTEAILAFERRARDGLAAGEHARRNDSILIAARRAREALAHNTSESLVIESFLVSVL